jgi:hypothetical protein
MDEMGMACSTRNVYLKKNFTTLKAYINLSRGHVQYVEVS